MDATAGAIHGGEDMEVAVIIASMAGLFAVIHVMEKSAYQKGYLDGILDEQKRSAKRLDEFKKCIEEANDGD